MAKYKTLCPHCNKETNVALEIEQLRFCEHCKKPINEESKEFCNSINWLRNLPAEEREKTAKDIFIKATSKAITECIFDLYE